MSNHNAIVIGVCNEQSIALGIRQYLARKTEWSQLSGGRLEFPVDLFSTESTVGVHADGTLQNFV